MNYHALQPARDRLVADIKNALTDLAAAVPRAATKVWPPAAAMRLKRLRPDLWSRVEELFGGDPYQVIRPIAETVLQ